MLKKSIILYILLTLLAACSNDEAARDKEIIKNVKEASSPANSQEQMNETAEIDGIVSLPEYQTIIDNVDNKDYVFKLVTDNEGKRIFFLTNEIGKKQYKSIFIKKSNHLKLIDLGNNSEIFNGTL